MINDEYLDDTQISQKQSLYNEMAALGLSYSDLNISLNVSNNWKIILYKHFLGMEEKVIALINQKINDICDDGNRINSMTVIFQDLNRAFKMNNIDVFPHEPYEIHPFDKSGKFTWGRFYQFYVSGMPKRIISNNISFIQSRFNAITNGQQYSNKTQIESLFAANKASWILKYYNKDLSLNLNAFYAETFKIISNIIQYKIPYYLTFYISIFRLFLKKNPHPDIKPDDYDINKIINIFEDGDLDDEYSQLLDYGIPITTVNNYSVGIYMRLSKDDERNGESLSIENQRNILANYVREQGWTIYDEYVDDGISGVTFDERPNGNMVNTQGLIRLITFL